MKILVCPDSFKGSLSAQDAAAAISESLKEIFPDCEIKEIPLADGGEGTADIISGKYPDIEEAEVLNAAGKQIRATYITDKEKGRAFIESAAVIGLPLLSEEERNPMKTSSSGLGQLIADAIGKGYEDISVSLGGSATCDGGMGMLTALGYEFYDKDGNLLSGNGDSLQKIEVIKTQKVNEKLKGVKFQVICDVENPLLGDYGAAAVFAPQKGALPEEIPVLERGLVNLMKKAANINNRSEELSNKEGAGAAGGLGYAFYTFLNGKHIKGIDYILAETDFNKYLPEADLIITGEGKIDPQSIMGKVVGGVTARASKYGIPIVAFGGKIEDYEELINAGLTDCFEISDPNLSLQQNMNPSVARKNLKKAVKENITSPV